ncbi:MAG: SEC-C metal-binding domain-containing protein, partial [Proteobacteria bacterium]|nr:SEC-C metal-binding domain-containing protein [Pseudomonadota bacterium]
EIAASREIVLDAGGVMIMGTERHESRRIDNQLRGRSGRQGDPGASRFYLSLEDDLMRIFGSERMDGMLQKLGIQEDEAIAHPWVNKALEKAQQKVEERNFEARKYVLKFDDVMNDQRKVIYEQRIELMRADDVSDTVADMRHSVIDEIVARCIPEKAYPEQWDIDSLHTKVQRVFALDLPIADWAGEEGIADQEIRERITQAIDSKMAAKVAQFGPELMRMAEKGLLLEILDRHWKEHLFNLDHLRQGIGLRAYAQRDPLIEYKREAFNMFETMLATLREIVTQVLSHVEIRADSPEELPARREPERMQETRRDPAFAEPVPALAMAAPPPGIAQRPPPGISLAGAPPPGAPQPGPAQTVRHPDFNPSDPASWGKVGRNAPCPCGSGKKYKHCHGRVA